MNNSLRQDTHEWQVEVSGAVTVRALGTTAKNDLGIGYCHLCTCVGNTACNCVTLTLLFIDENPGDYSNDADGERQIHQLLDDGIGLVGTGQILLENCQKDEQNQTDAYSSE